MLHQLEGIYTLNKVKVKSCSTQDFSEFKNVTFQAVLFLFFRHRSSSSIWDLSLKKVPCRTRFTLFILNVKMSEILNVSEKLMRETQHEKLTTMTSKNTFKR